MGKYLVKVFLNNIFWDNSYADSRNEAEECKQEYEDNSVSIWDRINTDSLKKFIGLYHIENEETILVTAEIV